MVSPPDELGLAEAIAAVRAELRRAQDEGRGSHDVRFAVGDVEVELAVDVTKTGGGGASVRVLSVLSIDGKVEASRGETHRVKITLNPIQPDGEPFEISTGPEPRPDGAASG